MRSSLDAFAIFAAVLSGYLVLVPSVQAAPDLPFAEVKKLEPDCRSGRVQACENLTRHYDAVARAGGGPGVTANLAWKKKIDWAEISCRAGGRYGCDAAGWAYDHGKESRAVNASQAFFFYKKGCDNGASLSCNNLGLLYRKGQGTARSDALASKAFARACSLNYSPACPKSTRIVAASAKKAGGPIKSCQSGNIDDCWTRYDAAKTRANDNPLTWAKLGCGFGNAALCFNSGLILDTGSHGNRVNLQLSNAYYLESCNRGNARGCYNYADQTRAGAGVPQNYGLAYNYYHKACLKGFRKGCEWRDRTQRAMNTGGSMDNNTVRRANDPNGYLSQSGPVCRPVKIIQNGRMHTKTECLDRDVAKKRGWIK